MVLHLLLLTVFPACMAFAAAMDLVTMTIPNRLVAIMVAGFFALAPFAGLGLHDMALHLGMALAALAIVFVFFAMGWIGGGDAKLFAATALWLGPVQLLTYSVYASMFGGALTLGLLFARTLPLPAGLIRQDWIVRLHEPRGGIPYGIALAAAGLMVYPQTFWMTAL